VKQHTSRFLKAVSLFFMAFPMAYILTCAMLFDIPARSCVRILLSPWYYILSALAITVGYGFWEMKRWAWYLFILVDLLIAYQNAVMVNEYGETHHKALTFVFSILIMMLVGYRVAREIRVPYFFPRIRWWESDPRYRLSVPVQLERSSSSALAGDILDLSMGGCFVKLRSDFQQDEKVSLAFTIFHVPVRCEGTVVWRTQSTVTHPKGVGIKFLELDRDQRRALKIINRRLKRISDFYKRSRYLLNQEEFIKRLQELESTPAKVKISGRKSKRQAQVVG
jgi:Tfp pilus assembly protein PilZ